MVAVDAKHIEQLACVSPVWRKNAPEIFERPLLVIVDGDGGSILAEQAEELLRHPDHRVCYWHQGHNPFAHQREKMLTAFAILAPSVVRTPWWCKIDLDAFPTRREPRWLADEWFDGDAVVVAPRWGYTKLAYGSPVAFDDWADQHELLKHFPRTGLVPEPGAKRIGHERFCSWISFYSTDWTRWAAGLCPTGRLPVPSQDGYHALLCARTGARWNRYPAKRALGWTNCPKTAKLREATDAALRA